MKFFNEYDIELACRVHGSTSVRGRASYLILAIKEMVNEMSDGWAYWPKPVRACRKLMEVIENDKATEDDLKKAIVPVKSFCTRNGLKFPE